MKNGLLTGVYPKRPKIKEAIMFGFTCAIILLITVVVLFVLNEIALANATTGDVTSASPKEPALPGVEVIAGMFALFAIFILAPLGIFSILIFLAFWTVGLILSTKLVLRIQMIPSWMHIISVILTVGYLFYLFLLLSLAIRFGVLF